MSDNLYVDIHVIQNVPPANINRDDSGAPKKALYGGVSRARVSSQSWKRAARLAFADALPNDKKGTRTKRLRDMLASRIAALTDIDEDVAQRLATATVHSGLGIPVTKKTKKDDDTKEGETAYLVFFGLRQIEQIAQTVADNAATLADLDDKALPSAISEYDLASLFGSGHSYDVALFGRMIADRTNLNVDAATQVAHAISTHEVEPEFDFLTAVDDEKAQDPDAEDVGAGHLAQVEFNSATLYRYATVAVHQLLDNLDGSAEETADAVGLFLDGFVRAMPTGHQNRFAHRTLPYLVVIVVRSDQPVNLATAFEAPVRANSGTGISAESAKRLATEAQSVTAMWGNDGVVLTTASFTPDGDATLNSELTDAFGEPVAFPELLNTVRDTITNTFGGSDG